VRASRAALALVLLLRLAVRICTLLLFTLHARAQLSYVLMVRLQKRCVLRLRRL
jgi:hypothetical protein